MHSRAALSRSIFMYAKSLEVCVRIGKLTMNSSRRVLTRSRDPFLKCTEVYSHTVLDFFRRISRLFENAEIGLLQKHSYKNALKCRCFIVCLLGDRHATTRALPASGDSGDSLVRSQDPAALQRPSSCLILHVYGSSPDSSSYTNIVNHRVVREHHWLGIA